jgi:hypothetical protein
MKQKLLIIVLLLTSNLFSQEYYYNEIYLRDTLGKFNIVNKDGCFEIKNDSIYLFEQELEISSKRLLFNEKEQPIGNLYTCSDRVYYYTLFLTFNDELYFYTNKKEMLKFKLKKNDDKPNFY